VMYPRDLVEIDKVVVVEIVLVVRDEDRAVCRSLLAYENGEAVLAGVTLGEASVKVEPNEEKQKHQSFHGCADCGEIEAANRQPCIPKDAGWFGHLKIKSLFVS